jgi:hypothetical protein
MKHIQINQFDPARLFTYLLSRLVESHAIEQTVRKTGADTIDTKQVQLPGSPPKAAREIFKAAERRWPSRYY